MAATGDLSNLLGDDVDQQQALLDNILLLSTSEGGLSRVMGDGEAGWEILVEFAFGRRFGWSEGGGEFVGGSSSAVLEDSMYEAQREAKRKINDSIDRLLLLIKKLNLTSPCFVAIARGAPTWKKPVVRQRAYLHCLEWVKKKAGTSSGTEQLDKVMPTLERLVVDGITDVWSATRKATAEKLHSFASLMTLEQLGRIFVCIFDRYSQAESESGEAVAGGGSREQWREKEGCILGINAMIRQFVKAPTTAGESNAADKCVRVGSAATERLPSFVIQRLPALLFGALAHPQLSVREIAAKAFSSYLQRSDIAESVACLDLVKDKLAGQGHSPSDSDASHPSNQSSHGSSSIETDASAVDAGASASNAMRNSSWKQFTNWKSIGKGVLDHKIILLEAYEAQGLLSLCEFLFKTLPSSHILGQWPVLFPTINSYLAHSASTVRQACSSLFSIVIAKSDQQSPILQRLVLQSMSTSKADVAPSREHDPSERKKLFEELDGMQQGAGAAGGHRPSAHRASSDGSNVRPGVTPECEEVSEKVLWSSWEWHEGRLLAFELLLGHLVKDHTGRLFHGDMQGVMSPKSQTNSPGVAKSPALHENPGASPRTPLHFQESSPMPNMSSLSSPSPNRRQTIDVSIPSLLDRLREASDSMSSKIQTTKGDFEGTFEFEPLGVVLSRIFTEVLNGVLDVRWEVRRMALQVLPHLTMAAMWHDAALVETFWRKWLQEAGVAAYVAALSIKEAVVKSIEYSKDGSSSSPSGMSTNDRVASMVQHIHRFLPEGLPALGSLISQQNSFRICALGVEIVIIIHCKLPSVAASVQKQQVAAIVQWLEALYTSAHDAGAVDASPQRPPFRRYTTSASIDMEQSPIAGPWSEAQSATPDSGNRRTAMRTAENVERALIKSICPLLPDFVATCDVSQMTRIIPVLSKYLEWYKEDLELVLPLVEALHRILQLPLACWSRALMVVRGGAAFGGMRAASTVMHQSFNGRAGAGRRLEELAGSADAQIGGDRASPSRRSDGSNIDSVGSNPSSPSSNLEGMLHILSSDSPGLGATFQSNMADGGSCKGSQGCLRVSDTYKYLRPHIDQFPALQAGVFEAACDVCVKSLLALVEAPTTEVVLLRAVLGVLLDVSNLVGDGRYMHSMCEALATRLRNPELLKSPCLASEQSPQHLQIMSNDITPGPSDAPSSSGGYNSPVVGLAKAEGLVGMSLGAASACTGTPTAERVRASIGVLSVDVGEEEVEAQKAGISVQAQADKNGESEDGDDDDDDDDDGSDWDDWSEDEDVSAVEEEISRFISDLKESTRAWSRNASNTPWRRQTREILRVQARECSSWEAQVLEMPPAVVGLVHKLALASGFARASSDGSPAGGLSRT